VDIYQLTFATAVTIIVDVDDPTAFDTYVALFDWEGRLIAFNDDSGDDPGSSSALHSFLGVYSLPSAGTYYLSVSEALNPPNVVSGGLTLTELFRPDGEPGGWVVEGAPVDASFLMNEEDGHDAYTIHISQTPEPSTWVLLGLGLAGVVAGTRRRKRS